MCFVLLFINIFKSMKAYLYLNMYIMHHHHPHHHQHQQHMCTSPTTNLLLQAGDRMLCSGRGYNCSAASDFKCNCTAGYSGPGCEYRDCPSSRSWFQQPHLVTGRAHLKGFKCSNGGTCDETKGEDDKNNNTV